MNTLNSRTFRIVLVVIALFLAQLACITSDGSGKPVVDTQTAEQLMQEAADVAVDAANAVGQEACEVADCNYTYTEALKPANDAVNTLNTP